MYCICLSLAAAQTCIKRIRGFESTHYCDTRAGFGKQQKKNVNCKEKFCRIKVAQEPALACEKNKQERSQLHTPPGRLPTSLSEVHPPHWLTLKDLLGTAVTIHSRLSFSHAPVTVFVFAIFCFVFFWQHCIIGDTLCLKRNSPAQQCGLFVHRIWQATESQMQKKRGGGRKK